MATTATAAMLAPQPTAGLDRLVVLATEPFLGGGTLKQLATLVAIPGPPPLPNIGRSCCLQSRFLGDGMFLVR